MKKKFVRLISAVLSAAMTLTAVPLSAFAEGEAHTHDGESNVITTPLDFREKTADENGAGWSWDHDTKTLTLNGVNIQATTEENMMSVVTVPDGTKIVLNGENTIVQTDTLESDTYVLSAVNNKEVNCDGTMTISGDGVLNAENRSTDSMARSLGGSIILNGGTVNATGTVKTNSLEIHNDGVLNANATTASFEGVAVNVSGGITVDGNGSLTAVGCANESTLNSAILLTSNFGDKISVSENGSITVPEGNAARVGIYYSGNNGDGMDAEISGGKVTAYGAKYGIYKVNLIMSGTGSVYTTGGSYAIGQTVPTIDEDEFVVKGSTESKASESAVTGEVKLNGGYYEIDGADAKTVVIKPDTSPRIILGKQTGIFKTEEYEIIEGMDMTDTKLKGTVYFDITLKNMSDEEFADARGYFGGDEPDLLASIIKTDYGWVCMVCDTKFSVTYDTDNTLTIKCGDIVSNTVQVKSNANRFNKVTQGDNTNRTVFYTNTSQEEKDNYKLVSTYTVDSESISYNWYSTNSAYSADELGAAVSGSNGEFKLADNIPAGNYVLYCDITYTDGDSTETVTEKFTFTYKECAHENGYSDGKCTNCGALCDHSNIDIDTGKCNECERQFVATISTDGNAPTGYDTLADCLNSITADTGNYVKIYQDIGDASATATLDTIDVKHNVMIDLNGHKLNNIKLEVNKDVTLTLTGTEGSYVDQVYVCKGGSFIIDSEANVEFDTIFAEAGTRFTVSDGANVTVRYLAVKESLSNEGNATSVKLATGMKITEMLAYDLDNSSPLSENIMLKNLLSDNQMLKYESSSKIINLYYGATRIIINSKTYGYGTITVVEHTDADHKYSTGTGKCEECGKPCEHGGDINTDTGICSICGAVVSVAIYTDANGISKYVDTDELHSLLNEYNGSGTIKLFKDYDNSKAQYDLYGELTIDLNGRRLNIRSITPCKNGKLTIKNSGNPVMLGCNVYPTNDASYAGGTLIIDGDVVLDTSIYVYDSSTVILKDGTYPAGLYARDSKTLYDMLGEGKAFFKTDGTLFNASVKEISSSVTLIVKDHSHTYVDGKCGCGYVCTHSDVDSETGKCTECEYQYAAVIVKDGAAASVYKETEMEAAFETADSEANTGCTLRVYKNYTGSYTTLSGKFTLWIAEKANVGTLTVSGDITVTGSGKNNRIYGDFNVAAGGKLTFDEKCGAMGTVSVGAGTFDCYSTFSITLNINDASSDVILHGGAFKTICYNGGGDRANAEILTLLAENRMFMKSPNPEPIDGSKTLLKDGFATPVIVIPHEGHSYDSTTGKCTICGKRCGHTDVDSKTGVCSVCEYQLTAGISGVGTAKYFDNIDDAFTAALSAENNGCTLTLYKHCEITQNVEIGNTTVTVDVNGCSLGGEADISVNNSGVLYLKDSRKSTYYGCIDAPFSVNGGTLINGTADGGSSAADVLNLVINSAKRVEIYGGIFENVYIAHASGVALYGGRYNTICGEESNSTPVNALLAKGYAFAILNSVTHLPESIVDGSAKTIGGRLTNVMVVAHEHRYNVETGKCPCGVCALAIFTETTQSSETYTFIESETQFKNIAENEADGVLKLTGDVDCIVKGIIINGNKTIDMNGHTLNVSIGTEEISAVAVYGNVTFENSGSSRAVINATGVYSYGMVTVNGDIEFDTFATFEDGDALINAGVFKSIYVQGRSVIEILGSGKALASESGEILNASVQQIYKAGDNIFVTAHPKHTYDEHGNCACGYKCLHDGEGQVDEDSANKVCSECGAKIYAKVTTADGKVKYFDDITEGLRYADKAENKGCVFTLVTSGKLEDGVKLSSGKFTITANDYVTIYETADGRGIIIEGADVIAEGHMSINCDIYVNSGSFTLPEGSSTRFGDILIFGGNVNISEGVNADNNAGADNLIIANDATDAKVTIGGGTYGRIVFGQLKLKDVLASGARVIRYDNSSDSTAEKTATALLYSDIAEESYLAPGDDDGRYYLVTKCEHKNEDGSYAFNEGGICKYCNSEFAASVSYTADGGEKTELFSDICDAFDKANEIGTATVTLYKDITDSERTQEITVMGNVTLELNGKTLGGRYGIARISVSDGGTLTVNGDGNMDTPIYVNENSKLVINGGGYFNSVSVKKGGNAEIGGGTIRGLSVRGNVKLSGGKFNDIEIFNGNLESVLADGYAYKNADGTWLSIDEREKNSYLGGSKGALSVEEAPIKSATATANKTVLYRNGGGARQILFNFNVNTSDGYTISDANKVTVGLYVGDTLIRESDFGGNSYTFANADEISDTDGTVKAHLVIKLNGYEYVTDDVEFEIATCTHPYDALTTDEHDYYRCSLCDASINAILVKTNGDKACYTDNVPEAFEAAQLEENNGCTLELYRGVNRDCEITQGSFTVLFKKTGSASAVIKVSGGNVKITGDDGCTLSKYPGSSVGYLIAVTGGTVTFDDITINDDSISVSGGKTVINGGTYNKLSVSGGTVTINSGTFSSIDVSAEGKALKDLLGENKAFTTSDGKLFDASKVSESDMSLTVIDHSKHEYDEKGRCGCGYQCAHSEINAEGVCNECNAKMYAAVTVKSETGTTVKYFTKLTEAFEFAAKNENKGCTLKMLRDFFDRNTDINVNGGKLTVDMNGFGVYFNSFNGSGTQITIRSDSKCTFGVENGFSMDGGTVTFSGEVSVVCQNVKLNATYFSSYVETLKIDTLILEDGVLLKQLASITNANIANIDCSSEIYLYQILASGSRVDSQLYSDLKANASSNFDNVRIIRCDHPDGVGRDNRCIYCNSLIAASVSYTENGAEKTEYFVKEDLGKAFAKANSVAIATITMLMSSAYDTDYLPVTGDVTLIANGDNAILYNTVKVADGGKLTLRGNANIFAVIAEPGSRLTAEEATRIAYLTVNGGDVKLSGGQYDNITVKDGKITDILGNGYAYKKTEGGAWLTLKEREVSEASGVTVAKAPIVQATLSTEINKLYRNSNANPTLKFNLALAHGSNLNDSYVSKRYGINSYVSGDIIYSSLSALVKDAKLSADEIIDKAGNSVAAKIYFVVITDDGYEIKSNTVSIDLVDCDHSQVVDPTADKETAGNITEPTYCEICESKFNAKITKGDDVRYYNNLDEAAKDARKSENEGCTLYPLYNKNGYGGQLVITEGNFTLKYAVRTAFSRPIIINGKAKLTVTGRCAVTAFENQDAFIVQGGDVTFEGLATGSNVTINGGNVTMAANNINCLTINGGNVSISSGGFAKIITNVGNKVIADYIDPGFWVQDRGTKEWIDIYSLNKATASSTNGLTVRLCPMQIIKPIDTVYYTNGYYPDGIPSLQISAVPWYSGEVDANVAYQWIAIDENGNETEIEGATDRKLSLENLTTGRYYCRLTYSNAATAGVSMKSDVVTATITECEHSGGEATCTKKAKCEICGAEYGEPLGHDYVVIKVVEPDYRNEGYSVFECTRCKDSYIGNRVPVKPIPDVEEIAVEKTTYNEVDISWKNISGVDGYYVECYVGNQWKQIGFSTDGDRVAAKLSGLSAGLKYKVRIAAYAGRFTAKFRCFYVDTVPSPVWNINTVKATDETVRISWSRNARADGYKVEWYINNQWSVKTVTGNNNISAVIDGLCAGTRYKVRVSAYKGDLYSPYTYGYIDTLPSKVTGITKTVTSSSFTLKWDKNESADGYTAQYYADGKWNEKTLTGNNKTTVTIGSLKGYKTYKVRIKAYKGELESAFDDIYITTAPTKVSGLKVKSAVDSKAVVIWNADANADGYNVGYYIGGKWVEKTITDNKTAMAVLGGLTPYSTYKVRVRAYKGNLYGDYSYTTVTAVLSPVTDIKVVSAKSNSITVKWGKNASADGYKVEIYKGGKWVKKTLKGSTNATVTIGGLRAGSVYKVRIASYKGANTSAYTYANVNTAK